MIHAAFPSLDRVWTPSLRPRPRGRLHTGMLLIQRTSRGSAAFICQFSGHWFLRRCNSSFSAWPKLIVLYVLLRSHLTACAALLITAIASDVHAHHSVCPPNSPSRLSACMSSAVDSSVIVATPRRGRPRRQHKCQHCGKTFKRSEHCIRHERTHTLEKPFCCRYCHKSYARKYDGSYHTLLRTDPLSCQLTDVVDRDLVTRHERTLHAAEHSQSQKHGRPSEPSDNDQRAHNGHEEQEDADQVIVADRLNVNQSAGHRAMQQLPDKLPDTPPRDCEEPPDPHDDIMPRILAPSQHHLLSPVEQVALSPSPSSSTSTQTTTVQSRARSLALDASGGAMPRRSAESSDMPAVNYMEIARASSLARGSNGLSLEERSQLPPNDNMYGSVERSAAFHPHQTDPMEIDFISSLSTGGQQQNMAPPPISRAMGSAESLEPRQDQRQYPQDQSRDPQSSLYDDSLSLFAQVEPGDIDLADFSFHPLPGQLFDLNYDGVGLQLGNNGFGAQSTAIDPSLDDRLNSTQQADAPDQNPSHRGATPPAPDSGIHPLLKDQDPHAVSDVRIDNEAHLAMRVDLAERLSKADVDNEIPSPRLCESFLSSYITSFSCHLPIIHLPTLIPQRTPSPLILAMCSIGALYRLDRRRAQRLHDLASKAVKEVCPLNFEINSSLCSPRLCQLRSETFSSALGRWRNTNDRRLASLVRAI